MLMGLSAGAALVAKRRLPVRAEAGAAEVSLVSIFSGTILRSNSAGFRGGAIYSIFGGTRLDLRRARPVAGGARLLVTTIYGGTDITVPDSWTVIVTGPGVAAGVHVRVPDHGAGDAVTPRLAVKHRTIFGGLSVVARPVIQAATSA